MPLFFPPSLTHSWKRERVNWIRFLYFSFWRPNFAISEVPELNLQHKSPTLTLTNFPSQCFTSLIRIYEISAKNICENMRVFIYNYSFVMKTKQTNLSYCVNTLQRNEQDRASFGDSDSVSKKNHSVDSSIKHTCRGSHAHWINVKRAQCSAGSPVPRCTHSKIQAKWLDTQNKSINGLLELKH